MASEINSNPVIIYGAARSGTTYLTHLINTHPDIFISDETRIFVWAHRAIHKLPMHETAFFRMRDDFQGYLREAFPALISGFYAKMFPGRRYWGDKNPHYVADENEGCLETILDLFPDARFIHIIRDGRDVVCSGLRGVWKDFDAVHQMWTSHVNRGCDFGRRLPADRYFELRYEDLIRDDMGVARQILTFLGIEMHKSVVNWCLRQREKRIPLCVPTRDIVEDVTSSDWSVFLSPEQRVRSLELIGRELVRYGYESASSFRQAFLQAADQQIFALLDPLRGDVERATIVNATVLIVSKGDEELLILNDRIGWHFPRSESGEYAGSYPADSAEAIAHLESLRAQGAEFLVFPKTAFWWLDYYAEFRQHLESRYRVTARGNDSCVIFDLRSQIDSPVPE